MRKLLGLALLVPVGMSLASCANQDLVDAYKDGWTVGHEIHEDGRTEAERNTFCDRALEDEFGYEINSGSGREAAVFSAYANGCSTGARGGPAEISRSELASLVTDP